MAGEQKEKKVDYKKIRLKFGFEIHQQLATQHKLFCGCSTAMMEKNPIMVLTRKQHPVASELGEFDIAAQHEYLRNRTFYYQVFSNESCLVECDEEPPHELNKEALETALQVALLLNCSVPNEIHAMRKTVIDGSNTTSFQRTMVVGLNGFLRHKGKKIEIKHVSLEEDAAAIVKEDESSATFRLNRLGIPLIEVGTNIITDCTPEEAQDIAYQIGMIVRSTGKAKKGLGTIRQDVNVSVRGGERVEIKGVQELGILAKVISLEVERQLSLPKVAKEVRAALPDGTTKFTRPLPGAARMYPETDVEPVVILAEYLARLKKNLPESWEVRLRKIKRTGLSDQLAEQIVKSEYVDLFERIAKERKVDASVVANTFTSILKDLRRDQIPVDSLRDEHFHRIFDLLKRGTIAKEAIQPVLKELAREPGRDVTDIVRSLGLEAITATELKRIIRDVRSRNPDVPRDKILGLVMSRVRGRIDAKIVMKLVK